MDIKLVKPSQEWFIKLTKFKKDFVLSREKEINGSCDLHEYRSLSEWLVHVNASEKSKTDPGVCYLAVSLNGKSVVGSIFIHYNHEGTENDLDFSNIDFYITKNERQKGNGKFLLRLGLIECKKLGMQQAIIVCDKDNEYASKAIQSNYGVLLGESFSHNKYILRYRVDMKYI